MKKVNPVLPSSRSLKSGLSIRHKLIIYTTAIAFLGLVVAMTIKTRNSQDLGLQYLACGKYADAADVLEGVLQSDGPTCLSYIALSNAYNQMNRFDKGLKYSEAALKLFPADPAAWIEKSRANLGLHNYKFACDDAKQALSYDARNDRASHLLDAAQTLAYQGEDRMEGSDDLLHHN
jgi:tetratricopeptide (TPR) repeat protein